LVELLNALARLGIGEQRGEVFNQRPGPLRQGG
jgi:hypothetical protein